MYIWYVFGSATVSSTITKHQSALFFKYRTHTNTQFERLYVEFSWISPSCNSVIAPFNRSQQYNILYALKNKRNEINFLFPCVITTHTNEPAVARDGECEWEWTEKATPNVTYQVCSESNLYTCRIIHQTVLFLLFMRCDTFDFCTAKKWAKAVCGKERPFLSQPTATIVT